MLSYLSDAAGFIIEVDTPVKGKVDVWSTHPVTKDEAVDLLNSMLNKNGYAAIRNGRTLTIVSKDEAIHGDIPVKTGQQPGRDSEERRNRHADHSHPVCGGGATGEGLVADGVLACDHRCQ